MISTDALGVKIDNITLIRAKRYISRFLSTHRYHQIATVNPDFVMIARKNTLFRSVLNGADLALADGVGIYLPLFLEGKTLRERIPGSDLAEYILAYAQEMNLSIFLAVRSNGLSSYVETKAAILRRYPQLTIHGTDINVQSESSLKSALSEVHGDIIMVNFGAPEQDIFLSQLRYIPDQTIRLGIGVGGTFDYWTGKKRRAPLCIQHVGLEWLWRLILQPRQRFKRTFNYVVVFSVLCLIKKCEEILSTVRLAIGYRIRTVRTLLRTRSSGSITERV